MRKAAISPTPAERVRYYEARVAAQPRNYPVLALPDAGYDERTVKNVEDSDGTLIIAFGRASGGTAHTIDVCRKLARPHLIVDATSVTLEEAVCRAERFVSEEGIRCLNVAGPRASGEPRGYEYASSLVSGLCLVLGVGQSRGLPSQPSSA